MILEDFKPKHIIYVFKVGMHLNVWPKMVQKCIFSSFVCCFNANLKTYPNVPEHNEIQKKREHKRKHECHLRQWVSIVQKHIFHCVSPSWQHLRVQLIHAEQRATSQLHHVSNSTSRSPRKAAAAHCLSISGKLMRHRRGRGRRVASPTFKMHYPQDGPRAGLCLTDREVALGGEAL